MTTPWNKPRATVARQSSSIALHRAQPTRREGLEQVPAPMDEPRPSRRAVKPRSDRYCLSEQEQRDYTAFVEMLSQLDKGARLQLAEAAIKEASQLRPGGSAAAAAAAVQPQRPQ